jgi:hypothetical protein
VKAAFTLALAAGVTSATSLRRSTADATQSAKLGVRDSSFLEALTSKYNCRDASASLEQTLSSVRAKNVQEETEREEQCNARTTQYTTPWTAAQANYDRDFPLVAPDEAEQERVKIENAHTSFNAAEDKLTKAVTDARDVVDTAQVDFESKKDTYDEKHGEHVSAVGSAADAETEWQTITKPAAELRINGAFSAAQGVADGELSGASIAANTAKTNGNTMCAGITAARSKHIDADELLLNKHIVPLLKELSESKCVDALTDANFEERKTAHAANSLLQEAMSSETKAKCALASSKARSFLETTHYLGSLPLDTQFDGNFQVFTDRVAEEKTHMNQLNDDCVQRVTDNFEAEMKTANDNHETAMRSATTAQTNAFESESKTYDGFTGTNNANVEKKAAAMVEPLRLKDAAHTALTLAKTKLTEKISTKDSVMEINKGTRDGIIRAAGTARLAQIEFRQNALNLLKTTAKEEFESNEKFVQEYCASAKEDLKKELDVLDKIDAKMLKLRVTNTAEVGKTDVETASLATFKAEDDARDEAARVEAVRVEAVEAARVEAARIAALPLPGWVSRPLVAAEGQHLSSHTSKTMAECEALCDANENCNSFARCEKGDYADRCWMKHKDLCSIETEETSTVTVNVVNKQCVTVYKKSVNADVACVEAARVEEARFAASGWVKRALVADEGQHLSSHTSKTMAECEALCDANKNCNAVQINSFHLLCLLLTPIFFSPNNNHRTFVTR